MEVVAQRKNSYCGVKINRMAFPGLLILLLLLLCSCAEPQLTESSLSTAGQDSPTVHSLAASSGAISLAPGDSVTISVWGQGELSKNVMLDSTGYIRYPLVGEIKAEGLTIAQLEGQLTSSLRRYYTDPLVTVMAAELAGQSYYILGEIHQPGKVNIKSQTTIAEAVAAAGGLGKDAGETAILLRKQPDRLLIYSIPLKYRSLNDNHLASITTVLRSRDILYVPPSTIADVEKYMLRLSGILTPLLDLERGIMYWPQLIDAIKGTSSDVLVK
ncbi:MAG: hypothetical protein BWK76_09320 [Desulfobulbaceae bacterium A2]|nr:MAG: hypothetical protein BWK76_09320 [Desulfobulbaceae bacterium A2]